MKKILALIGILGTLTTFAFTDTTNSNGVIKVRRGELGKSDYVVTDIDFNDKVDMLNEAIQYIAGTNVFMVITNNTMFVYRRNETNDVRELIWAETNNLTQISSQMQVQLNQRAVQIENSVQTIIQNNLIENKAWGHYAPDGSVNPDSGNSLFINTPSALFAAGYDWQTTIVGDQTFAVLTQSGSAITASGVGSTFRIGPSSTNYFGYCNTASQLVPCRTNGIRTYAVANTVELDYDYDGAYPTIYWSTSLTQPFTAYEASSLTWRVNNDGSGTCTVTIPQEGNSSMFFYAMTEIAGLQAFTSTMPMWGQGGTVVNKRSGSASQTIIPEYNDVYIFTNGTKRITIPCYSEDIQ